MKHQYKTEIRWKRFTQNVLDFFVDIYAKIFIRSKKKSDVNNPKKILFIILAQLGDALVMSYVFPFIKERFPNSDIDVLIGEWAEPILKKNPYVKNLIFFNHFRMNRTKNSILKKIITHIQTYQTALNYIRFQKYDLSIEGGVTHPNGNIITYRGRVKRRIGFGSGGFGSLLSDEVPFPKQTNFHIMEAILGELRLIGIYKTLNDIQPYFYPAKKSFEHSFSNKNVSNINKPYVIVHPESGNNRHLMSKIFWQEVVKRILKTDDHFIIICGIFYESSTLVEFLLQNVEGSENRIINAVQKLSLDELYILSNNAIASITLDSLAAHLCSISCRTLSFYNNGYGRYFFPISGIHSTVVHNHLSSRQMLNIPKCESMYVEKFEFKETYDIIEKFLNELTI